jgi:hypothetical protein
MGVGLGLLLSDKYGSSMVPLQQVKAVAADRYFWHVQDHHDLLERPNRGSQGRRDSLDGISHGFRHV